MKNWNVSVYNTIEHYNDVFQVNATNKYNAIKEATIRIMLECDVPAEYWDIQDVEEI